MARAIMMYNLFTYRFFARFWRSDWPGEPVNSDPGMARAVDFQTVAHTPYGLEFWAAHRVGEKTLMSHLVEMGSAQIVFLAREPHEASRIVRYRLGDPKHFPVLLDARDSGVALDGVIFGKAEIISISDKVLSEQERDPDHQSNWIILNKETSTRVARRGLDRGGR